MTVTKLLQAESSEKEYVFEITPLLTDEVLAVFNQRIKDSSKHFTNRDGKLVISAIQMQEMESGSWTKEPAKVFSDILTEIARELAAQKKERDDSQQSRLKQTAKFFGIPLE